MVDISAVSVTADGYACKLPGCHYASQTVKSLHNHIYHSHPGQIAKHHVDHPVRIQRLYPGGNRVWFRTQPAELAVIGSDLFTTFLTTLPTHAKLIDMPIVGQDRRDESPFMRKSDWHRHVQGHRPGDLIGLVAGPRGANGGQEPELERCRQGIRTYLGSVQEVIGRSKNLLVLQLLNSDNAEVLNHDPFKPTQERSTMDRYGNYFARLFLMILRWVNGSLPDYPLVLSSAQTSMATCLLHLSASDHTPKEFVAAFHPLAHSILTHTTAAAILDPWQYPLHCFLALSHVRQDGAFAPVTEITPSLAAIQWCFKAVVFYHIQNNVLPALQSDPTVAEAAIKAECAVLYDGRISPYSSLLQIKHLANTLAYQERSPPNVFWQNHAKSCLIVNGAKLHIQAIRDLIRIEGEELDDHFRRHLLLGLDPDSLPLHAPDGNVYDDLPEDAVGFSFATEGRNPFERDKWPVMKHLLKQDSASNEFHTSVIDGNIIWNPARL